MTETYELIIGDWDGDEGDHRHVKFNIVGWKEAFNDDCSEYFEISGICKPERAEAILEAVNAFQSLKDENATKDRRIAELEATLKGLSLALRMEATAIPTKSWKRLDGELKAARSALQDGGSNV